MNRIAVLSCAALLVSIAPSVGAAPTITADQSTAIVGGVEALVTKHYVFAEKRPAIVQALKKAQRAKRYEVTDAKALAAAVSEDLGAASHDKHLFLKFDPTQYDELRKESTDASQNPWTDEVIRARNHGYEDLRI